MISTLTIFSQLTKPHPIENYVPQHNNTGWMRKLWTNKNFFSNERLSSAWLVGFPHGTVLGWLLLFRVVRQLIPWNGQNGVGFQQWQWHSKSSKVHVCHFFVKVCHQEEAVTLSAHVHKGITMVLGLCVFEVWVYISLKMFIQTNGHFTLKSEVKDLSKTASLKN